MQLGMIGLGRMGGNIVRRLMSAATRCVVYDRDAEGGRGARGRRRGRRPASLDDLVEQARQRRAPSG